MKLAAEAKAYFRSEGRRGGRIRARNLSAPRRSTIAAIAGTARALQRNGYRNFEDMGLPGAEIVDAGLKDIGRDLMTEDALAVMQIAHSIRSSFIPFPKHLPVPDDARMQLYRMIERRVGPDMAHADLNAKLERLSAFINAFDAQSSEK